MELVDVGCSADYFKTLGFQPVLFKYRERNRPIRPIRALCFETVERSANQESSFDTDLRWTGRAGETRVF